MPLWLGDGAEWVGQPVSLALFVGDRKEVTEVDSIDSNCLLSEMQAREDHGLRGFSPTPQLCRRAPRLALHN